MIGLLFSAKWTIYQLYHGKNKLHFLLDQQAELDLRVLVRWNNNPRERIILNHNQLALARNATMAHSGKAATPNFKVFGLSRPRPEATIYRTRKEHTNHYTKDVDNEYRWK